MPCVWTRSVCTRSSWTRSALAAIAIIALCSASPAFALDAFDRHTSTWLRAAVKDAMPWAEATAKQAEDLKRLDANTENPCLIIRTGEGNLTKALVSWGLRKGKDKVIPVLLIERYVTYTAGRNDVTSAAGGNVMLFPGFIFNFDIGQVVPEGQGGDVQFTEGKALKALEETQIFGLNGSALPKAAAGNGAFDPTANEGVVPADFAGVWKLNVDGRWKADLELKVDEEGVVTGKYISAETKSGYPLDGVIAKTVPHRIKFLVDFGASKQGFEGFLWTKDKNMFAGMVTMDAQRFGVVATRDQPAGEKPAEKAPAKSE
jgi:hypothetical protein